MTDIDLALVAFGSGVMAGLALFVLVQTVRDLFNGRFKA